MTHQQPAAFLIRGELICPDCRKDHEREMTSMMYPASSPAVKGEQCERCKKPLEHG